MNDSQQCPITPKEADQIMSTLKNIDERMQKIERLLFAGRVAVGVFTAVCVSFWWITEHLEQFRAWLRG